MKTNPILKEIRQTRDQLAEEAGLDLRRLFSAVRKQEKAAMARGETLIASPSCGAITSITSNPTRHRIP
jgi:hypothetical protein